MDRPISDYSTTELDPELKNIPGTAVLKPTRN